METEAYPERELTEKIIGAAMEVHREVGPGLLESAYEECLCLELGRRGMRYSRQVPLAFTYKGALIDNGYRLDFVVEDTVLLELKAVEKLLPLHQAQLLTYLRLSGLRVGMLINFNEKLLKNGIRRLVQS